jgi:hypothetical protein
MRAPAFISWHPLVAAVLLATAVVLWIEWQAADQPLAAGFWFEGDAFGSAMLTDDVGGPIGRDELAVIEAVAREELRDAFAGQRLTLTDDPDAFFRVRVVPAPPTGDRARLRLAGESRPLGPFGGQGVVYFQTVAGLAVTYAPPHAARAAMVDGIGRGIGRAAVHEFAHQMLPQVDLHGSTDVDSYEFRSSDRASQYYGTLHWAFAEPLVAERLVGQGLTLRR